MAQAVEGKSETAYLNTLRVTSTFAVIMIHIFSQVNMYFSESFTEAESYICIILRNIWQWCVPIFVMITGVLFLNPEKEITLEKLLKKYVLRIVLAITLFGIPYCLIEILFDSGMSFRIGQIGTAVLNVIQGKSWDHMWYLYMIAGLYLFIPVLKIFVRCAPERVLKYTLILLFVFTSLIPSLENILPYTFGIYLPVNSVYVFYLLLGYYIHHHRIHIDSRILWPMLFLYGAYAVLMPLNAGFITHSNGVLILNEYDSPVVVLAALSFFCIQNKINKNIEIINKIAPLCFGIYLIHPLMINFMYKYLKFNPENFNIIYSVSLTIAATIAVSLIFSYIARKINVLRKYVL
ncbi:MAG: acyltransferase family protein [Fibrobacter sp.]|jgi:surface polysaccharide O-acyltransferase-like enzyme|nr:acyltransferase family protein [Fibrobacter sp.]